MYKRIFVVDSNGTEIKLTDNTQSKHSKFIFFIRDMIKVE